MTREIKFRAWDTQEKRMLPIGDVGFKRMSAWGEDSLLGVVVVLPSGHDQYYPIERVDLMQFTGLHDKNGTPIYEGDIITYGDYNDGSGRILMVVRWDERNARFVEDEMTGPQLAGLTLSGAGEVIGNIYENPELLR
jgi:uncharacterized phage protein (TIGR01671 family)